MGIVGMEAMDFAVAEQKQEHEDCEAQRLAPKEANEAEEQRKQSVKELAEAEERRILAEIQPAKLLAESEEGKHAAEERKLQTTIKAAEAEECRLTAERLAVKEVVEAERQKLELEKANKVALLEKQAAPDATDKERKYNLKLKNLEADRVRLAIQFEYEQFQKHMEFQNMLERGEN